MPTDESRRRVNRIVRLPAMTLTVGASLTIVVLAFAICYSLAPDPYKNALIFFAACCAAAGQLAAALYSARTLQFSADLQDEAAAQITRSEALILGRAALAFVERWNHPAMMDMRIQWHAILETRGKPNELKVHIEQSDRPEQIVANVKQLLNFLEELALSVTRGYADEEIAKQLFQGIVQAVWHCMESWIKEQRATHSRREMWVHLENLYSRWK
jgi:hypothetical protein